MKPFDPTKPVQTRDGRPARILCTDLKGSPYPLVAAVAMHGQEFALYFDGAGKFRPGKDDVGDLVNIPEKIKLWVNVYNDGIPCGVHHSRVKADSSAGSGRIACVEIEVTEGQGL